MMNDVVNMALRGRLSIQFILHERSIVRRAHKGVFRGRGHAPNSQTMGHAPNGQTLIAGTVYWMLIIYNFMRLIGTFSDHESNTYEVMMT